MPVPAFMHPRYENSPEPSYVLHRELALESSYSLRELTPATPAPEVFDFLLSNVRARMGTLANDRMNAELSAIVRGLRQGAIEAGIDLGDAPMLEIVDADDGSVLIEWSFADRRLGFNIEPQEGQSGWYFAFSRASGGQCGSGLLASLEMKELLQRMFARKPTR